MRKTYKREIGVALAGFLVALAIYAMMSEDPLVIEARKGVVDALAGPILLFLGAAFGLDVIAKQTTWGGRPEELEYTPPDNFPAGN